MGSGKKPVQQMLSNIGQNFNTSAQAMANQPGITTAGLGLGVPKGLADVPVYLGGGLGEAWDYLRGNVPEQGESGIDKWESGWRDLAINVGSLGQNTQEDRMEKERAAGASLTMTSMASPGLPLPFVGKALKGGAAGIAGESLVKGLSNVADYAAPIAGKAASPVLDPLLKGAGKALVGAEAQTAKLAAGETKEYLKLMANSKSTTNYIKAQDPHVLATLSDKYSVPIARLDDLGEPLAAKFKQVQNSIKEEKALFKKKKEVIKKEIKASNIPGNMKSQLRKELTEALKPPGKLESLDSFVEKELAGIKMTGQSKHLIKEELKTHILYNQKYNNLDEAKSLYEGALKKSKGVQEAKKIISEQFTDPKMIDELNKHFDMMDNEMLVKSAQRLRTNYDNMYNKALLTGEDDLIKQAHQARLSNNKKVIDELTDLDPGLAKAYDQTTTQSWVGRIGKYANMFKAEPYIGDLTQAAESFPQIKINNAEALGIDYAQALKAEAGFSKWYNQNRKLTEDVIFSKYKNQLKALYEYEGISFSNKQRGVSSVKDGFKILQDKFDEFGYSFQSGARERLIENILLPSAYGQVKAWGRFTEGSAEFNNAVMNRTMKFMQDTGMIPTKMKSVAKIGPDKFKTLEHFDQAAKSAIDRMPIPNFLKKELKSSALFMTTWVKGAAQAKLQNYNSIVESLRDIGKTGAVTDYQRHKIIVGLGGIMTTMAVFGARGARVPGLFTEITADPTKSSVDEVPETVSTLLVNWAADTIKLDNDWRNTLRDGAFYKGTGRSAFRTESIPLFGAGLGNEIATSMLFSRASGVIDAAIAAVEAGDLSLFMEAAYKQVTPVDIDKMVDQQIEGKSYDSRGVQLDLPERGSIVNQIGAVSKNLTPEYEKVQKSKFLNIRKKVQEEYSRMDITQLLEGDNINDLLMKAQTYYPNDPDKQESLVKGVIEDMVTPEKSKLYKQIGYDAKTLLAMPDEVLAKNKTIQRLSKSQVVKIAAQSGVFESERQTLKLLVKAGKLDLTDDKVFDDLIAEITELETSPYKNLLNTEEEE